MTATARDVLDGRESPHAILERCPSFSAEIDLDAPLACVEADELLSSSRCLIPAELVFNPLHADLASRSYFGTSTNGLCSGNSILEASIHGLQELIEGDIQAFDYVQDRSIPVEVGSLTPVLRKKSIWSSEMAGGCNCGMIVLC